MIILLPLFYNTSYNQVVRVVVQLQLRKRVTSSDVAKLAGVSRSLVSAYLNGTPGITVSVENRAAIAHAIKELNYTVNVQAKSIKTGRSQCVAVYGEVYNALFLQMVEGIQRASGPAGYHVLLYGEGRNLEGRDGLIRLYRQGRIDGMITLDFPDPLESSWEEAVLENGIPYVTVEGNPGSAEIHGVRTDYGESVRLALDYLWERNKVPPAYLNLEPRDHEVTQGDRQRREAYTAWMAERGFEPKVFTMVDEPGPAGDEAVLRWLESGKMPMSVLSNWSRGAISVYRAAYAKEWAIGCDLTVMAADNTERVSRHMIPPLPCVEVPYAEMGERAFKLLEPIMTGHGQSDEGSRERRATIPCRIFKGLLE